MYKECAHAKNIEDKIFNYIPANFAAIQHYFQLNMLLVDHIIKKNVTLEHCAKLLHSNVPSFFILQYWN